MLSYLDSGILCSTFRRQLLAVGLGLFLWELAGTAQAQVTRGFDRTAITGAPSVELVRQSDLWMMEVQFKPIRLVFVDLPDPESGELRQEQVWYLAWRSLVRPLENRAPENSLPENTLDALPGPQQFIPTFTLITFDDPKSEVPAQILHDEILPAAIAEIRRVERAPHKNSVQVIQDVPAPTPVDEENPKWIYGAATWRGVDPETDFFKVILGGFSNGYELRETQGEKPLAWRKVIVQRYSRPGDRFDPTQQEFQFAGNPEWIFQPDPVPTEIAAEAN